ncbi:MAG: hypothetical protein GWO08_18040 [Gammaproteobacteria bacterium]|nr:hypothetical protein [Gammaproteobacteria bacterium]NIR95470.1 hypothetical protein [Gammaproteobacteria bacterium]NIW47329.1 hypothetical protein [Gammaproteobacteria bacterium]
MLRLWHSKSIAVKYPDGHYENVPKALLNTMIELHKISEFKRKKGWVVIGKDPIRGMGRGPFKGREKRCY